MISFKVTRKQHDQIVLIVKLAEAAGWYDPAERMGSIMDLEAVIAQGMPLDLDALEAGFSNKHRVDVAHDLGGIRRHIDRDDSSPTGGQLTDFFVPRMLVRQKQRA